MANNKLIAKNTSFLYLRMMVVMIINLYSVRIVLNALGVVDYGVFNVVAGVIAMLSCVTNVLASATQRYYSYALGDNKLNNLQDIFSTSIYAVVIISIIIILLGETIGRWFVNTYLVIPENRVVAANWLFQTTIISFVFGFIQTPYSAAVIAHENMGIFATVNTIECLLKLGAAFSLKFIIVDRLIIYGILLALISIMSFISYAIVAHKKYIECHYKNVDNKSLLKDLLSFSGWNFIGSFAGMGMHYINTILVNIFFGPIVNAAQAVAFQVSNALNSFSGSFIMAVRPPMIKSFAEKNYTYLNMLFDVSNKVIYYCMLIVCVPLVSEMPIIIHYWLGIDDSQTVLFCRLIVIYSFILVMNNPISIIMQATGYVKQYFISVESFTILCPIISYILFKMGFPAYSTFIAMISCIIGSHIIRIVILKKYYSAAIIPNYLYFLVRSILVTIIVVLIVFFARQYIHTDMLRLLLIIIITIISTILFAYLFGISKADRNKIHQFVSRILYKK